MRPRDNSLQHELKDRRWDNLFLRSSNPKDVLQKSVSNTMTTKGDGDIMFETPAKETKATHVLCFTSDASWNPRSQEVRSRGYQLQSRCITNIPLKSYEFCGRFLCTFRRYRKHKLKFFCWDSKWDAVWICRDIKDRGTCVEGAVLTPVNFTCHNSLTWPVSTRRGTQPTPLAAPL